MQPVHDNNDGEASETRISVEESQEQETSPSPQTTPVYNGVPREGYSLESEDKEEDGEEGSQEEEDVDDDDDEETEYNGGTPREATQELLEDKLLKKTRLTTPKSPVKNSSTTPAKTHGTSHERKSHNSQSIFNPVELNTDDGESLFLPDDDMQSVADDQQADEDETESENEDEPIADTTNAAQTNHGDDQEPIRKRTGKLDSKNELDLTPEVETLPKKRKRSSDLTASTPTPRPQTRKTPASTSKSPASTATSRTPTSKAKTPASTAKTPASSSSAKSIKSPSLSRIAFSNSTTPTRSTILKNLKKLGCSQVDNVKDNNFDVLVVGNGVPVRTFKLLMAVAVGKHVVTDKWASESAHDGELLDPSKYTQQLDGCALGDGRSRRGLFKGKELFITPALKKDYGKGFKDIEVCPDECYGTNQVPISILILPLDNRQDYRLLQDHVRTRTFCQA